MKPWRILVPTLAAIALAPLPASSAAVPEPLAVSDNVTLLGNIPGSAAGMVFSEDGSHAFVTGWATGVMVLDLSDPAAPAPVGVLPLPHFENEDVEVCGDTLLVTNDRLREDKPAVLYVVDVADPAAPSLLSELPLANPEGDEGLRGGGHIANFVTEDCTQVWLDGGNKVHVVDLTDPAAPVTVGTFRSYASQGRALDADAENPQPPAFEVTHDTEVDDTGTIWSTGGGGAGGYRLTDDPLNPRLVAGTRSLAINQDFNDANSTYNDFIFHNSERYKDVLLVTEEDYVETEGGDHDPGSCNGQGKFETWTTAQGFDRAGHGRMKPLDTWQTELNGMVTGGAADSKAPITANCSSHWFEERAGIAAVAWYEQGVRFLDVRKPKDIRQVGYYLPADGATWAAYWAPGADDIVYTADVARGIDVLRIDDGGTAEGAETVEAPILDSWFGTPGTRSSVPGFQPSPTFGWFCPLPEATTGIAALPVALPS